MPKPKPAPALGFDLAELAAAQVERHHESPQKAADAPPAALGRPKTLPGDAQPFSVRLSPAQRQWLLLEAADRTLHSGERHDAARIVRELIDQARGSA